MNNYIASVDCGNANTAALLAGTRTKSISIPSIRVRIPSATLGLGKDKELQVTSVQWFGETYAVGDDALLMNRQLIDRHMGVNRYGGEHHQFMTAYALARLGVKAGQVDLTLMCPPAMYNDIKKQMKDAYTKHGVSIMLKGDKNPREWAYESVSVIPEGYGAVACFTLDAAGQQSPLVAKVAGDIVVLDTGSYTANIFRLHNTLFNPADLPKSSLKNGGGNMHIRQPILEWVQTHGGDLQAVTLDDIDRALRLGSASGDYNLQFGRTAVDLQPMLEYVGKQYAEWLANQLDTNFNGLQDVQALLVVGGNAPYIMGYLQQFYGKVIDYQQLREFSGLHPADLNAVGGLRMALARLNAKR